MLCPVSLMSTRQEFCHPKCCSDRAEFSQAQVPSRSRDCCCCWRAEHCPGPGRPPILMEVQWGVQHPLVTLGPFLKGCGRAPGFVLVLEWDVLLRKDPVGPGFE